MAGNPLRRIRTERSITQATLAKLVGTSQSNIAYLEQLDTALSREWAERLAPHLGVSPIHLIFDDYPENTAQPQVDVPETGTVKMAPVVGTVGAGMWVEFDGSELEIAEEVPYVPGRFSALEQRAYRVTGPSMNRMRIADGEFVIAVPYWMARQAITDGDVVVIERRRGHLVERTVKQIEIKADTYELWPRSTDIRYQTPIVVPRNHDLEEQDGTTVEIVGLVIGRFAKI